MLVEAGGVDDEERPVAGIRIAVVLPDAVAGRRLGDAAGPLRDGAVGVARPLSPQRGEVAAEPRDLVGADLRGGGEGEDAPEDERGGGSEDDGFHVHGPGAQNEYLMEVETKSRSRSSFLSPAYRV